LKRLKNDNRFIKNANRLTYRSALMKELNIAATQITAADFLDACEKEGVPVAPIRNLKMVFDDPRTQEMLLHGTNAKGHPTQVVRSVAFRIS